MDVFISNIGGHHDHTLDDAVRTATFHNLCINADITATVKNINSRVDPCQSGYLRVSPGSVSGFVYRNKINVFALM